MSYKLVFKWLSPYFSWDLVKDKGIDMPEELNRLRLADTFASNKLEKFHPWQPLQLNYVPNLEYEEILTLKDFLVGDDNTDLSDTSPDTPNNSDNISF